MVYENDTEYEPGRFSGWTSNGFIFFDKHPRGKTKYFTLEYHLTIIHHSFSSELFPLSFTFLLQVNCIYI